MANIYKMKKKVKKKSVILRLLSTNIIVTPFRIVSFPVFTKDVSEQK